MVALNGKRLVRSQRALINGLETTVAKGYAESIRQLCDEVLIRELTAAIAARDVDGALDALNIEAAAFAPYRKAILYAFEAGGNLVANTLPNGLKKRG